MEFLNKNKKPKQDKKEKKNLSIPNKPIRSRISTSNKRKESLKKDQTLLKFPDPFSKNNKNKENLEETLEEKIKLDFSYKTLLNEHSTDCNTFSIIFKISDLRLFVTSTSEIKTNIYKIYSPKNNLYINFKLEICVKEEKIIEKSKVRISLIMVDDEGNMITGTKSDRIKSAKLKMTEDVKLYIKFRVFNNLCKKFLSFRRVDCNVSDIVVNIDDYINLTELEAENQTTPFFLRIDIETYGQDEKLNSSKCYDHIGIINEGNTCYMNSMIQILFHLPIVRSLIFKSLYSDNNINVVASLQKLFFALLTENSPIKIQYMLSALDLDTRNQHDVHEIFTNLLETIEKVITNFSDNFLGITEQIIHDRYNDVEFSRKKQTFCFIELPIYVKLNFNIIRTQLL